MNPITSMINGLMETQEERDAAFQERMKRVEINRQHKLKEMNEPYMWDKHWQNEEKAKRFTEGPQPELKIGYGSVTAANNIKSAIAYHKLMQEKRAKEEGSK